MDQTFIPIPGLRSTVRDLLTLGTNIVLLTNGTKREAIKGSLRAWDADDRFGVRPLADKLYSSHLSGVRKPDAEAVNFVLRDLNQQGIDATRGNTLLVGDYIDDIRTADNVGMDSVLFVRGNGQEALRLKTPRPTFVITRPNQLLSITRGLTPPYVDDIFTIDPVLWTNEKWHKQI